jgi:hypothetical protein
MNSDASPTQQQTPSSGDLPSQIDATPDAGVERNQQQQTSTGLPGSNPMQAADPDESQQQAGGRVADPQQIGEGSYEGTQDYKESMDNYLEKADVGADARAAAPQSAQEESEMKAAEQEAMAHSKAPGQ